MARVVVKVDRVGSLILTALSNSMLVIPALLPDREPLSSHLSVYKTKTREKGEAGRSLGSTSFSFSPTENNIATIQSKDMISQDQHHANLIISISKFSEQFISKFKTLSTASF